MARHPKGNDKINYILAFLMDACDAPVSIYVKTLWPALLEALISWYALDMVQIFTAWVRPHAALRGVRGSGHGRSRKPETPHEHGPKPAKGRFRTYVHTWKRWIGFDPWDEIGRRMPLAEAAAARAATPGVVTMWNIYDLGQRYMFWVMFYEITEEFFYKWSSGIAQSWYCQQQYRPWVYTERGIISDPGVPGGAGVLLPTPIKARWGTSGPGNQIYVEGQGSQCVVSAVRTSPENGRPMKLKIVTDDGDYFESNEVWGPKETMSVNGSTPVETTWYVIFDASGIGEAEKLQASCIGASVNGGPYKFPTDWKTEAEWQQLVDAKKSRKSWADELLRN